MAEGCSSGTRPTRPRLLPAPLPTPPPPLTSPPPSLDDSSRAGQKRSADDTASHTPTAWSPKVTKHTGQDADHQSPEHHTKAITDVRPQQYTHPAGDMGPRPQHQGPTPQASPHTTATLGSLTCHQTQLTAIATPQATTQSPAILDSMDDTQEATAPDNITGTKVQVPRLACPPVARSRGEKSKKRRSRTGEQRPRRRDSDIAEPRP